MRVRTGAGQPRGMEQRLHVSERGKGRGGEGRGGEGRGGEREGKGRGGEGSGMGRGEGVCQYRSRTATGDGAASTRE